SLTTIQSLRRFCDRDSPAFTQFPFQFQLPEQLPSSFEYYSETGRIIKARVSFSASKAEVENSRRTASHRRERPILIINFYDLNFGELSLSKSRYVPGEDHGHQRATLFNSSTSCVKSTHITFQQRVFLSAGLHRNALASGVDISAFPASVGMPHCEIIDIEIPGSGASHASLIVILRQMCTDSSAAAILRRGASEGCVRLLSVQGTGGGSLLRSLRLSTLATSLSTTRAIWNRRRAQSVPGCTTYYKDRAEGPSRLGPRRQRRRRRGGAELTAWADMSPERRRLLKQRSLRRATVGAFDNALVQRLPRRRRLRLRRAADWQIR
uniref:Uncharacterized protein n=1 Tax=Macrostomum lignano TaxID=282301 RepID=A0A1I8JP11_9PLAT